MFYHIYGVVQIFFFQDLKLLLSLPEVYLNLKNNNEKYEYSHYLYTSYC